MVRTSDRIVVLGLSVIGVSIIGLVALLQHHEPHAVEPAWSSRQQPSVVTGAVGYRAPTAVVDSGEQENTDAGKSPTPESASSIVGPDAGDELDERPQASSIEKRVSPPTTTRVMPAITQQPGRHAERKRAAPQSDERAASARDTSASSEPHEAEIGQAESPSRDATVPAQPAMTNSAPSALTEVGAMQSRPGPLDALPPAPATPRPKSRQDVQDELRKARSNGSLPRFGNPDPYGPGGSPSAADR